MTHEAFLKVAKHIEENDDKQISVNDLISKMEKYLEGTSCTAYSLTHMKNKLKVHFGAHIVITQINRKSNIVTFRIAADRIMHSFYEQKKTDNTESESQHIAVTAAKLIRNIIKCAEIDNESYPTQNQLETTEEALKFVPSLLVSFLQVLMIGKDTDLKLVSIGQAIMQACWPRVMLAPLQFGLSTQMHHMFGSRFFMDSLNKHGFGCSYSDVQMYERSAALRQGGDVMIPRTESSHIEFIADNVDHDVRNLDGHGMFHGMGIVDAITPALQEMKQIPRQLQGETLRMLGRSIYNISHHSTWESYPFLSRS